MRWKTNGKQHGQQEPDKIQRMWRRWIQARAMAALTGSRNLQLPRFRVASVESKRGAARTFAFGLQVAPSPHGLVPFVPLTHSILLFNRHAASTAAVLRPLALMLGFPRSIPHSGCPRIPTRSCVPGASLSNFAKLHHCWKLPVSGF